MIDDESTVARECWRRYAMHLVAQVVIVVLKLVILLR